MNISLNIMVISAPLGAAPSVVNRYRPHLEHRRCGLLESQISVFFNQIGLVKHTFLHMIRD